MKAVFVTGFGGPELLVCKEVEKPVPSAKQVLIRVSGTSVNYADVKSRYGNYHGGAQPPFIPGLDVMGIIESVGEQVQELQVGQRVIAFPKGGSYAEYIVADENRTFAIPDSLDSQTAAAFPLVSFTSYQLLAGVGRLSQGESVLIHAAAGGIGTTAIQLAKLLGAGMVIGAVSDESKAEAAREAGADHVITYQGFAEKVNELTEGQGVDVILDSLAGKITEESLKCLAYYGRLVQFGNASGEVGTIETKDLHSSCRSVLGFSLGTTRNKRPEMLKSIADHVIPLLVDEKLKIKVSHSFPLEEAAKAHTLMESRKLTGKIILTVNE